MFKVLANLEGLWIFLIVLGFFALIAIVAFILHKLLRPKLKQKEDKPTEADYAKEELDRVLQPVEDEKVSKEIQDYKQNDDE
jgi:uncharacterized membrane protein